MIVWHVEFAGGEDAYVVAPEGAPLYEIEDRARRAVREETRRPEADYTSPLSSIKVFISRAVVV